MANFYQATFWTPCAGKWKHIQSANLTTRVTLLQESIHLLEQYYQLTNIKLQAEKKIFSRLWQSATDQEINKGTGLLYTIYQKIITFTGCWSVGSIYGNPVIASTKTSNRFGRICNWIYCSIWSTMPSEKMRLDDHYFNGLVFELYQFGIEKNILDHQGQISDHTFLNTCILRSKSQGILIGPWNLLRTMIKLLSPTSRDGIKKPGFG